MVLNMLTICGIEFAMLVKGNKFYKSRVSFSDTIEILKEVQENGCWGIDVSTAGDGKEYFIIITVKERME